MILDDLNWDNVNNYLVEFKKKSRKDFTILMSIYKNDVPYDFQKTLISILKNNILPKEFLIIFDGDINIEIERNIDYVKLKTDHWIKIIKVSKNKGLGNALRLGVENSKFDLIARADADDINVPNRFDIEYNFMMKNPKIAIVGGQIREFSRELNDGAERRVPKKYFDIKRRSKYRNPFNHPTVMFRKKIVLSVGNYRNFKGFEDYDLWVRILNLSNVKASNVKNILVYMNSGDGMYSRRGGRGYLKEYIKLKKSMLHIEYINFFEYLISIISMCIVLVFPVEIKKILYQLFLRN